MNRPIMSPFFGVSIRALPTRFWWITITIAAGPVLTLAQTDEIQVYDGAIAEKGKLNLMLHQNFTPKGLKEPGFP